MLETAISITLYTSGQNGFVIDFPNASQQEVSAAGIKYAFFFITVISVIGFLCSFFVISRTTNSQSAKEKVISYAESESM